MALVADSGVVYGIYDRHDRDHRRLRAVMERERGIVVIPTAVLGEIDYLLRTKLGIDAELDFLKDIQEGAFSLEHLLSDDLNRSRELIEQYRNLDLGLADAAVVATAERLDVRRIMTVDERDFRAIRSADGRPFTLLPA